MVAGATTARHDTAMTTSLRAVAPLALMFSVALPIPAAAQPAGMAMPSAAPLPPALPEPVDTPYPGTITLAIDASDVGDRQEPLVQRTRGRIEVAVIDVLWLHWRSRNHTLDHIS